MQVQGNFANSVSHSENLVSDIGLITQFRPKARNLGIADVADLLYREKGIPIALVFQIFKSWGLVDLKMEESRSENA